MVQINDDAKEFELIWVIINHGFGSKVLRFAKQNGISGGTVFYGSGTVKNRILQMLEISESRKEVVLLLAQKNIAYDMIEQIGKRFKFDRPNHGIAFCTSIAKILGARSCKCVVDNKRSEDKTMYDSIFTVVDKGKGNAVVEAAEKAGSRGGTIINARGAGIHETSKVFSMEIEPEKEIVLILSETEKTDLIANSIKESLQIEKPGNGIVFIQRVSKAYGLY